MHSIQQNLLSIAKNHDLGSMKLREIGELIGVTHPQIVKHHISQLLNKGLLIEDQKTKSITLPSNGNQNNNLAALPILGSANCGQATCFAEENYEGYMYISKKFVFSYNTDDLFVIKATGNSLNKANINGKSIQSGDYVIISKSKLDSYNNKYVLSCINGLANIKKFRFDNLNNQILLISESTKDYPPICIHPEDMDSYLVNGYVVDVIKKPESDINQINQTV